MSLENDYQHAEAEIAQAGSTAAMRASLKLRTAGSGQPGFLARLWRGARAPLAARRDPCVIVAVLMVLDRRLALDGLITSMSASSVVFRQAATFIFDRTGAEISIRFADHDLRGRITATAADGYVVTFAEPLDEQDVEDLLENYGQAN
ncbi:MAG: hypothetical protein ACRCWO_13645 [Bosea sp. (in: a-proteobacteria)]